MTLTEENFLLYAAKAYLNSNCETTEEFEEDMLKFKYLKKLFYNFKNKDIMKERLVLNHIIVLYNIFDSKACTRMLLLRLKEYYDVLIPFLLFLGYITPESVYYDIFWKGNVIKISDYTPDPIVLDKLRKIKENAQ